MRMSQPGPDGRANAAPWVRWLFPGIVVAFFVALAALPRGAVAGMPVTYTQFVADVGAGTVRAVTIGPAGQVTGSLAGGQPFTTTIPVALGGNSLAGDLAAHHVQVTATAATMSSSLLSVLIGLLPLLLFVGLIFLGIRSVGRHTGGGRRHGRTEGHDQGEGAGHRRRTAGHPVYRRGRVRLGEDRDQRGRRLSARPGPPTTADCTGKATSPTPSPSASAAGPPSAWSAARPPPAPPTTSPPPPHWPPRWSANTASARQ